MTQTKQEKQSKYPKMRFRKDWLEYIQRDTEANGNALMRAICEYGLYEIEPKELTPEQWEYFNAEIRPDLDRQHKRRKEGKRL